MIAESKEKLKAKTLHIFDTANWKVNGETIASTLTDKLKADYGGITEIGEGAFAGCPQLRNVLVPESVATISETSFEATANLTILCFGKSYAHTFAKKQELGFKLITSSEESIVTETLNDTVTWRLNLVSGLLYFSGEGEIPNYSSGSATPWYSYASNLTGLVIDEGIIKIGNYAFYNFNGFTGDLVIPNTVTSLGEYAFNNCTGFNGTLALSENLVTIPWCAFQYCYSDKFTVDKNATCTADGSKSRHCINCDAKTDITVIKASGHKYAETIINPAILFF